jgi:archaeosine synthase alpha-subunit
VAQWQSHGKTVQSPGLIFPETSFAQAPPWIDVSVGHGESTTARGLRLVSGGTWFHPTDASGPLVIPPLPTGPTTKAQTLLVDDELAVFHDAGGWASNPKHFVRAYMDARTTATPGRLLWAPALGDPADYALWVYLGVDLFDASPLLVAATRGIALTSDGPLSAEDAARLHGEPPWDTARLIQFNLESARLELARIHQAIRTGTLRALVERRIYLRPASVEILRRFDREHRFLEAATPRHRAVALPAMTGDSLWMPEVEAFRRSFRDAYLTPRGAKVLVLLPCSQRKPYKTSRSHRAMARVLDESGIRPLLHEVMITSPLGLVPRELEDVYPANQYDIPVTGHWTRDEEEVVKTQLASLLEKGEYDHVVVHAGQATFDVLRPLLPEHVRHTCLHHPTSRDDLERLAAELKRLKGELGTVHPHHAARDRKLEDLRSLASYQFGPRAAEELTHDGRAAGHVPYVKLFAPDGAQYGTTTADRGVLSLTLEGAAVLARLGMKRVFIQDFQPKKTSSLFAVGVDSADADVRIGDEVVVVHRDEVRGCGVAQMNAEEMAAAKRGVAVTLRHTAAPKAQVPVLEVTA